MFVFLSALTLALIGSAPAQNIPEPIPGVQITNGSFPWAVDVYEGKQQLVPIHHTNVGVNNHKGANVAGSLAGSVFYKPKMTTEIEGAHARVALHTDKPVFYVHVMDDDPGGDSSTNLLANWAIVRAKVDKDRRILAQINFTQLTGNAKRRDTQVDANGEKFSDGWLKITPKEPLAVGEYVLQPVPRVANTFSTVVFDFTIDPKAPNSSEARSAPAK
ncbi:hypothetical protein [Edaphobacter bradus]|uniref:hypothetical protein n=1 Tax=Edaphobacter bradus TaxID=2259016 RepID=UPI0021DFFBA1|nr:hypothetical protein [Edaphobacter bradus]